MVCNSKFNKELSQLKGTPILILLSSFASYPLSFTCTGSLSLSFEVAMTLTIVFQGWDKIVKILQNSLFFVVNVEKLKIAASLKASGTDKRYC
jgi:hypothetical protein